MEACSNLVEGINGLKAEGYTEDFNLKQSCIECREGQYRIFHNEFEIDKTFRFDDDTDPENQSILYAISSPQHKIKGVLVNGYGIYTDDITDEMLDKLKTAH